MSTDSLTAGGDNSGTFTLMQPNILRILASTLGVLLVSIPTLALAEDWHGHPLIDTDPVVAVIPGALVLLTFAVGGYAAGAGSATFSTAIARSSGVGSITCAVLILGAVIRRAIFDETFRAPVTQLWVLAVAFSLFVFTAAGALAFNRTAPKSEAN